MDTLSQPPHQPPQYQPADHLRQYRWPKGVSGNPAGQPSHLTAYVRSITNDGRACVDFLLNMMLDVREKPRWRLDAAHELLDRGYGRPIQAVDLGDGTQPLRIIIELPGEAPRDTITLAPDPDPDVHVIEGSR